MNHRLLLAFAALTLSLASCQAVQSSNTDVEFAAASSYIFRGLKMNDRLGVEGQGRINLNRGNGSSISGYAWGYWDSSGDVGDGAIESNNNGRFSRLDIGAQWSQSFDEIGMSAGVVSYNFPNNQIAGTSEIFVAAELTQLWYRPGAVLYLDIQNASDPYLRVGGHPKFELDRALTAELSLDIGFMGEGQSQFYYGADYSGVSDLLASAGVTYQRDEHLRGFIRVGFTQVLASELKSRVDQNGLDDSNIWFSLGIGFTY